MIKEPRCYNNNNKYYPQKLVKLHANSICHNSKTKHEKNACLVQHAWISLQETPYLFDEVIINKINFLVPSP